MEDIAPALLETLRQRFLQHLQADAHAAELLEAILDGKAGYAEAGDYAEAVGRALAGTFSTITGADLPDGRMYWNIADRVVRPLLEEDHTMVSDAAVQVQKALNQEAGLGLQPQRVPVDADKINGILNRLDAAAAYEDIAWILGEPVVTYSRGVADATLRANVEFQGKTGLRPKVVRRAPYKCCEWCSRLAGSYTYPDVPRDVYRRHQNCRCVVEYDPGSGRRQNVHTKTWTIGADRATIETESTGADARVARILRGTGGALGKEGTTVRKLLGTIDPADTEALETLADTFCRQYAGSTVENMLVITAKGEVHFITDNRPAGVDCTYLGDKLRGSYNIHTHPPETTQFSFSTDVDMPGFFADGSAVMEAVDYKYRYRFERPEGVTWEQWDKTRSQVEGELGAVMARMGFDFDTYQENRQHVLMQETCARLGISAYSRRKL